MALQQLSVSQVKIDLSRKVPLSRGLLPADFGGQRDSTVAAISAAASAIAANNMQNFQLWLGVQQALVESIKAEYSTLGLVSPPMAWDAFWMRVEQPVAPPDMLSYIRLVRALQTDYGERFFEHIVYRLANDGNVHIACRGPTGSGKSSCMIAVMDWIKSIDPQHLEDRLAIDIHDIPRKLSKLGPGDTLLLDELVATAGEGSRTNRMLLDNLEDTLRASQRNLIVASPGKKEHSTMQVELECINWNRDRRISLFLVWVEALPLGVLALPWCSRALYETYKPWKDRNVDRTLQGQFKDNEQTAKAVMQLFDEERFVDYLWLGVNKPKMGDFNTAIVLFYPGMLTQSQVDRMAKFAYEQCYSYQRLESKFEFFFGVKPNKGFQKIASKCYEE